METIRQCAIRLVQERGLDNVTAENIAEEAGISLRTFFNYFSLKEEALIPPPLGFPAEAAERFVDGTGSLIDDLLLLVESRLDALELGREHIGAILSMTLEHPRLLVVQERTFSQYEAELRMLLARRRGVDPQEPAAALLAAVIGAAFKEAVRRWVAGDDTDIADEIAKCVRALPGLFDAAARPPGGNVL